MADGAMVPAKKKSSLPAPVAALLEGIQPASVAKNLASVGGGFVAAQLGGRLVKHIDAVEHFASGGPVQEAVVDVAAGLAVDAVVLAGVGAWKGAALAFKVGKLMVVGTIIGAILPVVAQHLADGIEKVVDMVFGKKAPSTDTSASSSASSSAPASSPGGLYDHVPGGLYDHVPGGGAVPGKPSRTNLYQFAAA